MAKGKYEEWLRPDNLLRIEGWARDGLTDEQIAKNIGISRKTLSEWKVKYGDIGDALKKTKEVVDREVENALHKRALGYMVEEVKIIESEKDGKRIETFRRHIPGDVTAQIFWLKNRKPEVWRDKQEIVDTDALDKLDAILGELKNAADSQTE